VNKTDLNWGYLGLVSDQGAILGLGYRVQGSRLDSNRGRLARKLIAMRYTFSLTISKYQFKNMVALIHQIQLMYITRSIIRKDKLPIRQSQSLSARWMDDHSSSLCIGRLQ
jgi:hypothetical protein